MRHHDVYDEGTDEEKSIHPLPRCYGSLQQRRTSTLIVDCLNLQMVKLYPPSASHGRRSPEDLVHTSPTASANIGVRKHQYTTAEVGVEYEKNSKKTHVPMQDFAHIHRSRPPHQSHRSFLFIADESSSYSIRGVVETIGTSAEANLSCNVEPSALVFFSRGVDEHPRQENQQGFQSDGGPFL
ncbi:hypothetical protein Tco_0562055 [Tanacetum coccineum]